MLQTSENQLTLKQNVLKHRQLITNELTAAGYNITRPYGTDLHQKYNTLPYLIRTIDSPIHITLDVDIPPDVYMETIRIHYFDLYFRPRCQRFSTEDIQALAKLYIHMIQNHITLYPFDQKFNLDETLEPGQLTEIISEYLSTKS